MCLLGLALARVSRRFNRKESLEPVRIHPETLAVMKGNTSIGFTQEGVMTWKEFEHLWPGKGDWVRHESETTSESTDYGARHRESAVSGGDASI